MLVGNPVREEIARLGETAVPAVRRGRAAQDPGHRRKPGRDACSARSCPTASACSSRRFAAGCRSSSNAGPTTSSAVRARYAELGIPAELMTYIEDMPDKLADAHLVIGRAGASTIAELTAAGRPAILIPFAGRDRRSPDRQRARDDQGRRRADDPADRFHARRARPADRGDGGGPGRAQQCRGARAVGRPARTPRATSPTWSSGSATASRRSRSARRSRPRVKRCSAGGRHAGMMKAMGTDIGTIHFVGIGGIGMSGHRRGDAPARLQGAGLGRRRKLCRREAAQGRASRSAIGHSRRQSRRCRGRRLLDRDQGRQSGDRTPRPSGACRGSGAPRCSPS